MTGVAGGTARRYARIVVAIFVLSGAAGLIYEIVWSRQLVLVFGNTTQAVSAILTAFFGGMAIGSWLGGKLADRVSSPLRLYAVLEVAIAAVAILTPLTFALIREAYQGVYPVVVEIPGSLAIIRLVGAVVVLAPATIMMGATLPALTRHLTGPAAGLAPAFTRLYSANLIGAMLGTAAAGFVLIELLGLSGSLLVGAAASATAGLLALAVDRAASRTATEDPALGSVRAPRGVAPLRPRPSLAYGLAFVSGLTTLGYQVLWVRQLGTGTGGFTYVFSLLLVLFLCGLAIGARMLTAGRLARADPIRLIIAAQLGVAITVILGLVLSTNVSGLSWAMIAILVVIPTATLLGITFPASSKLLPVRPHDVGGASGRLLAVNTIGAIVGSFLVPFAVIPTVGTPAAIALLAAVNGVTATALLLTGVSGRPSRRLRLAGGLVAVAVVAAALSVTSLPSQTVARILDVGGVPLRTAEDEIAETVVSYVGEDPHLWVNGISMTTLTVDTRLLSALPMILRPEHRTELVIAFGMGSTYRTALFGGVEVEAVELVPSVPAMFDLFFDDAASHLADAGGRIVIADGRNHVEVSDRRFSAVVVDPPPPVQSAGVSVIASLEFYRASARLLDPGGVMIQWVPVGQTSDEMAAHIRTFRSVFRHTLVMLGLSDKGLLLVGSDSPLAIEASAIERTLAAHPAVLADISTAPDSPAATVGEWMATLPAMVWLTDGEVDVVVGPGPLVTDDRPLPEYYLIRHLVSPAEVVHSAARIRELLDP